MAKLDEPSTQPTEPLSDLVWALKYAGGGVAILGLVVSVIPLALGVLGAFTNLGGNALAAGALGSIWAFGAGFVFIALGGILHVLVKILEELKAR